jgi:hypothetical protein
MREKVKAGGHDSPYRLRKQLPEPVFGQIKQGRGFRQFLMRGIEKVRAGANATISPRTPSTLLRARPALRGATKSRSRRSATPGRDECTGETTIC